MLVTTDKVKQSGVGVGKMISWVAMILTAPARRVELMATSWRDSFCGTASHQTPYLALATARAGNVIGGGDWSADRIVPDAMRACAAGETVNVRNPGNKALAVLEPLAGYLQLAQWLHAEPDRFSKSYNFGPASEANRTVQSWWNTCSSTGLSRWLAQCFPAGCSP